MVLVLVWPSGYCVHRYGCDPLLVLPVEVELPSVMHLRRTTVFSRGHGPLLARRRRH
jgi:hypothetical protein